MEAGVLASSLATHEVELVEEHPISLFRVGQQLGIVYHFEIDRMVLMESIIAQPVGCARRVPIDENLTQ